MENCYKIQKYGVPGNYFCLKMISKLAPKKFMVFRALFLFEVLIQKRWYLTGETLFGMLLEERKLNTSK